jgi:hypothetical protein
MKGTVQRVGRGPGELGEGTARARAGGQALLCHRQAGRVWRQTARPISCSLSLPLARHAGKAGILLEQRYEGIKGYGTKPLCPVTQGSASVWSG